MASSSKTSQKSAVNSDTDIAAESQPSNIALPRASALSGNGSNTSPLVIRPKETGKVFRDASGRTYSVPNVAYLRLLSLQSDLSVKKTNLDREDQQLQVMSNRLELDRLSLNLNNEYDVDTFNRRVNQLNIFNAKVQVIVNEYNRGVADFNSELERVGTPIN
jgi:hypothetical protein